MLQLPLRIQFLVVGIFLGVLQTGYFFHLTFTFSSGFETYLLVTLCWLGGSIVGLLIGTYSRITNRSVLVVVAMAYILSGILLNDNPFRTQLWPIYILLVGIAGIYPGVFFVRMSTMSSTKLLFFWENNGFIVGLALGTISFMLLGRATLWVIPVVLMLLIFSSDPKMR